jgi:Uma2 family endonuclease
MSTLASTMPTTPPAEPIWIPSPLYRMTVAQYEAMVASGAFSERDRVHLINGFLVEKTTQPPPHTIADILCGDELDRVIPPGWHVRPAKPVRLPGQATMNEPDRCVVRGSARDYLASDPGPGDIALLVEVADSRLADDRELADKVYGPAGIPVYWIINLVDRQVEVFTSPGPGGYSPCAVFAPGQAVPVVIGGQQIGAIAVDDVLP